MGLYLYTWSDLQDISMSNRPVCVLKLVMLSLIVLGVDVIPGDKCY